MENDYVDPATLLDLAAVDKTDGRLLCPRCGGRLYLTVERVISGVPVWVDETGDSTEGLRYDPDADGDQESGILTVYCEACAWRVGATVPAPGVPDILWCRKCDWIGSPAQSSYEERHGYACPECGSDGDTVRGYSPAEAHDLLVRWQATPAMQDVVAKLAVVLADAQDSRMKMNAPDTLSPARQYVDLRAAVDDLLRAAETLSAALVTDDLRGTAAFMHDLDPQNAAKVTALHAALDRFYALYGEEAFPVLDTGGTDGG